jgi:hypothetical protein
MYNCSWDFNCLEYRGGNGSMNNTTRSRRLFDYTVLNEHWLVLTSFSVKIPPNSQKNEESESGTKKYT